MIRVFLSFVEEDLSLVNLFRGQVRSERNDLEFADYSLRKPFRSLDALYIKGGITDRIKRAALTICLYGPTTYQSEWVHWELNKTLELMKPIMGVCLYSDGSVKYYPSPLKDWPKLGWGTEAIMETVERLARN